MMDSSNNRPLSLFDAVSTMIGIVLGTGIFLAPAAVAAVTASPWVGAGLWMVGGVLALCGAATYAECAARLPADGGFFVYYERAFGPSVSRLAGWGAWLITYPASLTAVAWIAARYLDGLFHVKVLSQMQIAALLLVATAGLVAWGLQAGARVQGVLTSCKVLAIAAVALAALLLRRPQAEFAPAPLFEQITVEAGLTAFATVMWTFDGWSDITMVAGQIQNPRRNLLRAAFCGVMIPAVCYALVQIAVMTLLQPGVAARSPYVLLQALESFGGEAAAVGLGCLALVCAFGALHGVSTAVGRLGWSMARRGQAPAWFAQLSGRQVPNRALLLPIGMSLVYLVTNEFNTLMGYFAFSVWVYYGLTAAALLILRRRHIGDGQVWDAPWRSIVPGVVLLSASVMCLLQLYQNPMRTAVGVSFVLACAALQALLRSRRTLATAEVPDGT